VLELVVDLSERPPTGSAPDPIGRASARLYAAGVQGQQRLVTLRFLGILLESADEDGHVNCDPDDLVGLGMLHGIDAEEVTRSRALLETFDVLDREPTGWFIKHFAPVGDEVPPAEAMAAISRAMGRPMAEAPRETPAPAGSAAVVPMEPARARMARRWMAAPVGAAAAAAVLLVALMVSGQVHVPLVTQPASNGHQTAVGAGSSETSAAPGPTQSGTSPSASSSPSPSGGSATAPSVAQTPAGGAPLSSGGPASTQTVCPIGSVSATVDHMDQHIDSASPSTSFNVSLPPIVHTSVTGAVKNNSANTVVVNPFPVTVNFTDPAGKTHQTVTATALSGPTPVAPGASVPWSVTVQNPHDAPVPGTANAAPPTWRWDDAKLAATCPR
jgi:hypothetical protein